jgi:uncharacterized protein
MTFVCQLCGECCSTMGEIISIQEKTGAAEFRIKYTTTGIEQLVTLDPDKRDLFFQKTMRSRMACPFLRDQTPGKVICTVHHSLPDLCRQYTCFRVLILNAERKRIGRVMEGTRHVTATDSRLHEIWQRECHRLDILDEERWEEEIALIFTREGYRVIK